MIECNTLKSIQDILLHFDIKITHTHTDINTYTHTRTDKYTYILIPSIYTFFLTYFSPSCSYILLYLETNEGKWNREKKGRKNKKKGKNQNSKRRREEEDTNMRKMDEREKRQKGRKGKKRKGQ